ncbi:MAG: hypothetical protein OSJ46_10600 [Duncaniella sp.]|nr:hypothetical protein [Duncaniella sp.]
MTTTKSTPYLVSDRAFRIILTEIIEHLTIESVTPECFYAVITLVKTYLTEGTVCDEILSRLPACGYTAFLTFRDMIDKSIRRARSARAAAARRKEKKTATARKNDTGQDRPFQPDTWPPQSAEEPGPMVRDLQEIFFGRKVPPATW